MKQNELEISSARLDLADETTATLGLSPAKQNKNTTKQRCNQASIYHIVFGSKMNVKTTKHDGVLHTNTSATLF